MTFVELLDTVKRLGATLALHSGETITVEPPDVLTPALREALAEHHAALVALIRSGPSAPSSFDALMTAVDGLDARPTAEILQHRLRVLAGKLLGADPLVRVIGNAKLPTYGN